MMDMGQSAMGYVSKLGFSVFPLHSVYRGACTCGNPNCERQGKHPRTKNGLKDASRDPAAVRGWWDRWPGANIGIPTGRENGIVVIDVDAAKDGEEGLELLIDQYGELPKTWEQLTGGGGRHLVFACPDKEIRNSASSLAPGVDVRGDGGYIVAAPSSHVSGRE